jgi:hypothetical protein
MAGDDHWRRGVRVADLGGFEMMGDGMIRSAPDSFACPFSHDHNIAHCPLYIESHVGRGLGCVNDMSQPCLVARGKLNWQAAILKLAGLGIAYPGMIQAIRTIGRMQ